MFDLPCRWGLRLYIAILLSSNATAQVLSLPSSTGKFGGTVTELDAFQASQMDFNFFQIDSKNRNTTPLQTPGGSVSKLDLKSPRKARREYEQGYRLLMRRDLQGAVEHLTKSIAIYPSFVAAHNALGGTYLMLGQNEQARSEFAQSVALDDHLPTSFLNLGCAELALKQYPAAEESLRKASSIAPLDLQLSLALAYGEFVNHDYSAVLGTAHQVHERKHEGAALVHFFAAGAYDVQGNLSEAEHEMEVLLAEDPRSASADRFREILEQIKAEQTAGEQALLHRAVTATYSTITTTAPTPEQASRQAQRVLQQLKQKKQVAEAEASDPECNDCSVTDDERSPAASISSSHSKRSVNNFPGTTLRASVDEVALFFAVTDHGKSVMNLTASDIEVRDDSKPPAAIISFRNESQLPLRLGLIIDTSSSVTERFAFEQAAAIKFLQRVVTDENDLAFVVGVNNSVLLVQDFTADQTLTSRAVNQLAPSGGTALWDAVAFAVGKLATRPEAQPVARILVLISDGKDNSSSITLKRGIARAQRGDVAVYTVSTREDSLGGDRDFTGDHALRGLSEQTGGTAFVPGSIKHLEGSLGELQQLIRGRYLISYKPAFFQRDGRYRAIEIEAQKEGHKLRVFARKGYYAPAVQPNPADR